MEATDRQRRAARPVGEWLLVAWVVVLTGAMMAPTLAPGFVLSYDLVFTPRQDLLPASLGLGGGLPRAVPQDAVVALVETVVPGQILEKAVLLAIPLVAGLGMLRLLSAAPLAARGVAATLAVWNPFVAERLVIGHWGFLLAYALMPWALASAIDVRRGRPGASARLVLQVAAAGLTPSGSLLVGLVCVPIAIAPGRPGQQPGRHANLWRRLVVTAAAMATSLPWVVPAVLHASSFTVDPVGSRVFALRDEGWGIVPTALGLGGIWNADTALDSRAWIVAPILTLLVLGVACYGARALPEIIGRAAASWWTFCALVGLGLALASSWLPGPWGSLISVIPGGGLLRDAHKMLAPLALLLAAAAGLGIARLARRIADRPTRLTVVGAAMLIPVALLPDLAWGVGGRLVPVDYPPSWSQMREALVAQSRAGDVLVLPWSAFRRFQWNAGRTVLDPAPRWLPRTAVVSDGLAVETPQGVVVVQGEDPRAREVEILLESGQPLAPALGGLGIGFVLVEEGQLPPLAPPVLAGLEPVAGVGPGLRLYVVPGSVTTAESTPATVAVIAVDVLVLVLLVGAAATGWAARRRDGRAAGPRLVR